MSVVKAQPQVAALGAARIEGSETTMQIEGSTFIVTGGASGLGAATARHVVDGGGSVVIADLKDDEGQRAAPPSSATRRASSAPT